jgi:hypothetical protein
MTPHDKVLISNNRGLAESQSHTSCVQQTKK